MTETRISIGRADEWADGDIHRIEGEPPIAVYNDGGTFYATTDWCTHDRASLAEGWVEDGAIVCPWHMAKFCLRTGKALTAPASVDLECFQVTVEDNEVFVVRSMPS